MGGGSKGGHSAKDDDEEKQYFKHMIDFEGDSMDYNTIIDIEQGQRVNKDNEDGLEYTIRIVRSLYPGEKIYTYDSTEARDKALTLLRGKMTMLNTIFH